MNKKYKLRYRLAFGFASLFLVCSIHALEGQDFEGALIEGLALCSENSAPGQLKQSGELARQLAEIELKRSKTTKVFHSALGLEFVERKLKSETDDVRSLCLLQIAFESRSERAQALLKAFAEDDRRPTLQKRARTYLARWETAALVK